MKSYKYFDADTHVLEPVDMWTNYIDPKYKKSAPFIFQDKDGLFKLNVLGKIHGNQKGLGILGTFGSAWGLCEVDQGYPSRDDGHNPHSRIEFMNKEGIDGTVLYPSIGLVLGGNYQDVNYIHACYRAYNRWLADFCSSYPERLFPAAMIPLQSVDLAIEEIKFVKEKLGINIIFIRPNPYGSKMLHDKDYDRMWELIQELDMTVAIHSGSSGDMPIVGIDRFIDSGMMTRHIIGHTMEHMLAMLSVIYCGVCEAYPKIKFGFIEGGGGWLPGWLDRMDRHHEKVFSSSILSEKPSNIFKRQCWIGFDASEQSLPFVADYIGIENILWGTDFPHPDGTPNAKELIESYNFSKENKNKIFSENALNFYGIK